MNAMRFIAGTAKSLHTSVMTGMARYRHKVFVERLGWQLQCRNGQEYDQFDRDDTVYIVGQDDETGEISGTARLLPTTRPYLLREVFPHLMADQPLPCSGDIWELSRFAAVDFNAAGGGPRQQFSSPQAIDLLRATLIQARRVGAASLITISPLGIERLLNRAGFKVHRATRPTLIDGAPIVCCRIDCRQ